MKVKPPFFAGFRRTSRVLAGVVFLTPFLSFADPAEGLWVGRAVLNQVNEAVGAVDENGVRVQTPPGQTTPTSDQAEIFLMLHVDAAGSVRLLKSVAIVDADDDPLVVSESLITDPALYATQPVARRLASAAFEFGDPRSRVVIDSLAGAVATAASAAAATSATQAYNDALAAAQNAVQDAAGPGDSASLSAFLAGESFQGSPSAAAAAARDAAIAEYAAGRRDAALRNAVKSKVLIALGTLSQMADSTSLDTLPLTGSLAKGATLTGDIFLGAYHPTNPFRHRRNPAHRGGYDITRRLKLTCSAATDGEEFDTTDRGLDRLSGIYEEEVTGLHKPLGQSGEFGLKTKGTFVLDRISRDATLNN